MPHLNPAPEQLDIFADSRDVMLRNDVIAPLGRHNAAAARAALAHLLAEYPAEPRLGALDTLIGALDGMARLRPLAGHAELATLRAALLDAVAPAAQWCLGIDGAGAWMPTLWAALASRAAGLAFDASRPDDHSAALWLCAGGWEAAMRAVETIESWRRIPAPLAWSIEAQCRLGRLDDAWPLLAELAWIAPARLDALLRQTDDALLRRLLRRFSTEFDGSSGSDDLSWFPAWVLTDTPALAARFAAAQPSHQAAPERAMRLLVELLGLERQGRQHELMSRRRTLRDLHPGLFTAYMATR